FTARSRSWTTLVTWASSIPPPSGKAEVCKGPLLGQRHRNSLELLALCERHIGDGAAILQRRHDADCAEADVGSQRVRHRRPWRALPDRPRARCTRALRTPFANPAWFPSGSSLSWAASVLPTHTAATARTGTSHAFFVVLM